MFSTDFSIDVKKIQIAHEFTLDCARRCEYPTGRGSYGLVSVLEGSAEYRFAGGERITVAPGDCLLIPPSSAYFIETQTAFRHYTVNFDIHEENSSIDVLDTHTRLLQCKSNEQIEITFKRLVHLWSAKKPCFEMQATGLLYELLSLFYRAYTKERSPVDNRLQAARAYIEQHFDRPISLRQLAYLCSMSVTNFRREWAKQYAEPPMQYRDSIRLYYAKEYLNSGYYSVSGVAKKCGFDDVSYFIRFFKKKVGTTPGAIK